MIYYQSEDSCAHENGHVGLPNHVESIELRIMVTIFLRTQSSLY